MTSEEFELTATIAATLVRIAEALEAIARKNQGLELSPPRKPRIKSGSL